MARTVFENVIEATGLVRLDVALGLLHTPQVLFLEIRVVARLNPVNWAAEAARSAAMGSLDWGLVASRVGLPAGLVARSAWFATRAFGVYQRSL
jgi:hypothetical protein